MKDTEHGVITAIIAVAIVLIAVTIGVTTYNTVITVKAFECGYSEQSLPGHQGAEWVKEK